jgi:hypothetical protein
LNCSRVAAPSAKHKLTADSSATPAGCPPAAAGGICPAPARPAKACSSIAPAYRDATWPVMPGPAAAAPSPDPPPPCPPAPSPGVRGRPGLRRALPPRFRFRCRPGSRLRRLRHARSRLRRILLKRQLALRAGRAEMAQHRGLVHPQAAGDLRIAHPGRRHCRAWSHAARPDDPGRLVPNSAKKAAAARVRHAEILAAAARAPARRQPGSPAQPPARPAGHHHQPDDQRPGRPAEAAWQELQTAQDAAAAVPARIRLGEIARDMVRLKLVQNDCQQN